MNNKIQFPKQLSKIQLEALKMQLVKLNLHNKLLLTINKRIINYPHTKINDKMGSSFNQNIIYNFSKNTYLNNNNNNNNSLNYTSSLNNSSRIGVINFVVKIITSIFNSLYCIIAKPQFINKHDKIIIRIPYYQNNIQKDALFTNSNSNYIFNSLVNNLSDNDKVLINNMLKINNSNNITKNSIIKWLKDYLNLNIDNLNNKIIDLNTIDNYIKNDKIIDNKSLNNNSNNMEGKENNSSKLLMRIANSNNLEFLNAKRLSNLKITTNKLLMLKIINSLNYHNEKSTEILGKGAISQPVSLNTLDKLFGGVYDSKGYLGNFNFVNDYKVISTKLLASNLLNNNNNNIKNAYSKEIDALNKISNNKLMVNLKLINSINQKLNNLKSQFTEKNNESINFILNNIIKQFNPNILFYNTLTNTKSNNIANLLLLNRQLSLINKLGSNLLTINKLNNTSISNLNNNNKISLNIKIIKLIIKNNIILTNTFNNNLNNINNNENLNNKIKEALLSYEYYNNKAHNNNNLLKNNIIKFKSLGILLSKIFNKNISIELIRLWNVGLEPTILSQIISKNSVTDKSSVIFKKLWRKISVNKAHNLRTNIQNSIISGNNFVYNNNNLLNQKNGLKLTQVNDFIKDSTILNTNPITLAKPVGVSIKIAGRLATERIAPKRTTKSILVGSIEKGKGNVVDSYKFTSKNKRGAYTISVKLAHSRA